MKCKICNSEAKNIFSATILNKYDVQYYQCPECEYLFTEEPYWLDEAYEHSICTIDIGYVARNLSLREDVLPIISEIEEKKGFLDWGGGYGLFVRMMRDAGYKFFCYDKYTKNLFSEHFAINELENKYDAITCFEVFEHFAEPLYEIEKILKFADTIIFSTELLKDKYKSVDEWWYFTPESGQHISFYNQATLKKIAQKYKMQFYTNGTNLHIFSKFKMNECILKKSFVSRLISFLYRKLVLKTKESLLMKDFEMARALTKEHSK